MPHYIMSLSVMLIGAIPKLLQPDASSKPCNSTQHDCERCIIENAGRDIDREMLGRMLFTWRRSISAKARCCKLSEYSWVMFIDMGDIFDIFIVRFPDCRPQLLFHLLSCVKTRQFAKIVWGGCDRLEFEIIIPKGMDT